MAAATWAWVCPLFVEPTGRDLREHDQGTRRVLRDLLDQRVQARGHARPVIGGEKVVRPDVKQDDVRTAVQSGAGYQRGDPAIARVLAETGIDCPASMAFVHARGRSGLTPASVRRQRPRERDLLFGSDDQFEQLRAVASAVR